MTTKDIGGLIIPAARRVFYSSLLTAYPFIDEPGWLWEITTPKNFFGKIYDCLSSKNADIYEEADLKGTALKIINHPLIFLKTEP